MPIFEYTCLECGENFEKLVFGSPQITCPRCDSGKVQKKFSVFGMRGVEKQAGSGCSSCTSSSCSSCK